MSVKILDAKRTTILLSCLLAGLILFTASLLVRNKGESVFASSTANVVYLIPQDSIKIEENLRPTALVNEDVIPIATMSDWATIYDLGIDGNLQALIIHHAAKDLVDNNQLAHLFQQQGLIVAGVGIPGLELAQMVGKPELFTATWSRDEGYTTDYFYYIFSYGVEGTDKDKSQLGNPNPFSEDVVAGIENPLSIHSQATTDSLLIENGLTSMLQTLDSHISAKQVGGQNNE